MISASISRTAWRIASACFGLSSGRRSALGSSRGAMADLKN
jgi:hypothetical protein